MRIAPVTSNINFKSSTGGTMTPPPNMENNSDLTPQEYKKRVGCLNTIGNILYGGIVVNALILMPVSKKNIDEAYREKLNYEIALNKYYYEAQDSLRQKNENFGAYYHLTKLHEVDNANVMKIKPNEYETVFNLDKQQVYAQFNISEKDKNTLSGIIVIKDFDKKDSTLWINDYTIKFSDKNAQDFTLKMKSRQDSTEEKNVALQRIGSDLYLLKDGERIQLNKKNVQKFEERLQAEEEASKEYEVLVSRQKTYTLIAAIITLMKLMSHSNKRKEEENS